MNKKELAKALKPLIKECIREIVFEEKFLSNIISEVVSATTTGLVTEAPEPQVQPVRAPTPDLNRARLAETKKRMLEAVGRNGYSDVDVFEGTEPIKTAGTPSQPSPSGNPLENYAPDDPGVNINALFSAAGHKWNKLK